MYIFKKLKDLKDWNIFVCLLVFSREIGNLITVNWNFFFRSTYVNKFQMLVTIDKLREKIMQNSQELKEVGRQRNVYYYSL